MDLEEDDGYRWLGRRKQVVEPIEDAILLNERCAAELLGVSTRTLQRWRAERRKKRAISAMPGEKGPPYYRIGVRRVVYKMKDLEKWVESRRTE